MASKAMPVALLVDEDPVFLDGCVRILEADGFGCVTCASSAQAVERLRSQSVDLLVTAVGMSEGNGVDLALWAQNLPDPPAIVLLTALPNDDDMLLRARAEGLPIVVKPLDEAELERAIGSAMHERFLAAQGISGRQLHMLYGLATLSTRDAPLAQILDTILAKTVAALGGDSGSIMLIKREKRELSIAASYRLDTGENVPVPLGTGVSGWVAEKRVPIRIVGPLDGYPQFKGLGSNTRIAESLIAPILMQSEVLGTISVRSSTENRLGQEKLALLVGVADLVAATVDRDRLARAREHQDRLSVLGQLLASVAHELISPLSCVKANLETMSSQGDDLDDSEIEEITKDSLDAIKRACALVESLRGAARRPSDSPQVIQVGPLLQRAAVLVSPQLRHHVKLSIDIGDTPPVAADAGRIVQVLVNLLVNAGQAIPRSGNIQLRSRLVDDMVALEVEDDGVGIRDDLAPMVFDAFFTTKPEGVGTGLGLSISRGIARDYGGDLVFFPRPGGGTCFRLLLPPRATS